MKRYFVTLAVSVLACNAFPAVIPMDAPADMKIVIGGIADVRPFFGQTSKADGTYAGDFLLATCGCGDWRILLSDPDGSQAQFPVNFYSADTYSPSGLVTLFGRVDTNAALGAIDQNAGALTGDLEHNLNYRKFSATRGEAHTQEIKACVMCHIGDNPIWPRPPTHPVYVSGVTDCFTCHTVNIK